MRTWSDRSKRNMRGIHPDLRRVLDAALQETPYDFVVIEGLRTKERQKELVASGASQTLNSRHLTGHAVDLAVIHPDRGVVWEFPLYKQNAEAIMRVAGRLGVKMTWGGEWTTLRDGPHFELDRAAYPVSAWTTGEEPPAPRKITDSREIQGGGLAALGVAVQEAAGEVADLAADLPADHLVVTTADWIGFALTIFGIGLALYARLDDWKAGRR